MLPYVPTVKKGFLMFEIISRQDAAALGRKRFYTGRSCKYGHDAQRFVSTGGCVACNVVRSQSFCRMSQASGEAFSYKIHPDDYVALLAYAQALDVQRGRPPQTPSRTKALAPASAQDVEAARRVAFMRSAPAGAAPAFTPRAGSEAEEKSRNLRAVEEHNAALGAK